MKYHISKESRRLLIKLVKASNSDGISIYNGPLISIQECLDKGLLEINGSYTPFQNEISLVVLPHDTKYIRMIKQGNYKA